MAEISAVALTTSIGRFVMPYIKVDGAATGVVNVSLATGDKIVFSLPGYVDNNSVYHSILGELTTEDQQAFNFIGATQDYAVAMLAPTYNLYMISTAFSAGTTPSGNYDRATLTSWRHPTSGSARYQVNAPVIIEGGNGDRYLHIMPIYEYKNEVPAGSGTFSVSPPETGVFGECVFDVLADGVISCPMMLSGATPLTVASAVVEDILSNPYVSGGDPYAGGGESDTGGGTGTFDGTSVDVDFASLPTLSAVDTGFITLYNPNLLQLQSLANYMWSGLFDVDTFKKLFADPMQAILGLSIVPGPVPGGATQSVKIGNIDSGVSMTKAATQYIDIDCGTLNVEEFWGAYLDYEPYTKAEIFLPFIGVHQIAIDDIMNKSVHIKYHIDLLSGGCACEIKCGGSVLYTFIGSCAVSIPVTGSDWTNLLNGVLSAASAIGTMVATGGAAAPAAASTIASAAVNSLKPSIEKSGSIAGAGGLLAGKVPVLILTRPRQALPGNQNKFTGYPAFITRSLGALSGYTEVHSIRLSGIDGTESEIDEIEELLKGGVIL